MNTGTEDEENGATSELLEYATHHADTLSTLGAEECQPVFDLSVGHRNSSKFLRDLTTTDGKKTRTHSHHISSSQEETARFGRRRDCNARELFRQIKRLAHSYGAVDMSRLLNEVETQTWTLVAFCCHAQKYREKMAGLALYGCRSDTKPPTVCDSFYFLRISKVLVCSC